MTYKINQLITDMSSAEYHSTSGTFSSTQLKDLLGNLGVFVKKHIKKEIPKEQNDAFDVGTYFHTKVLEPHKLTQECIVYPGKVRKGADWDKFKAKHKEKAIVTEFQKNQAEGLVKAALSSPIILEKLVGQPEVSLFTEIYVTKDGAIHAPYYGKLLSPDGWVAGPLKPIEGSYKVVIKVRADVLGRTFISDLKSTTGDAESEDSMADKVEYYNYELSASLYLDMFSLIRPDVKEFWWLFASKDVFNSRAHKADSEIVKVGRAKYMYALKRLAMSARNNWKIVDTPGVIRPSARQLRWLVEKETDLV